MAYRGSRAFFPVHPEKNSAPLIFFVIYRPRKPLQTYRVAIDVRSCDCRVAFIVFVAWSSYSWLPKNCTTIQAIARKPNESRTMMER